MIKQAQVAFLLLCLIIIVGCTVPIFSTQDNFPNPTAIYQTVSAGLTATAHATAMFTFTPLAIKTTTPNPTNPVYRATSIPQLTNTVFAVTQSGLPCNRATAGKPSIDVTIPDGTLLLPGQPFSKTWRFVNNGTCTWSSDYSLVWFSGDSLSSTVKQNFTVNVPVGQSVDITVDMVAPDQAGIHQSNWKFSAPDGALFGLGPAGDAPFWVRIDVEDRSTPAAELAATLTPTSIVVIKDTVIIHSDQGIDLDVGKINASTANDLGIGANAKGVPSLLPSNGARIGIFGSQEPAETDCSVDTLSSDGIVLSAIPENSYICYRTNMGLPGFGKLSNITNLSFTLYYTTWMIP